jgi:nucleoside-diphosphate-sugar epimerase
VRVLDLLLHGQNGELSLLKEMGVEVQQGDIRDPEARRRALEGVDEVVNLAAIVGDPACARDPELAEEVNVKAARALATEAHEAGVRRFVFASTCSNYGRMADPTVPIDEDGELAPVSLYASQKVEMEKALLGGEFGDLPVTCLRFATLYGVAPRMRFDLTVNEFTRDLWADRELEVFGEQFWRPYVHVKDAARCVRTVMEAADSAVVGEVYNVGRSGENYRKLDLVELIQDQLGPRNVSFVHRDEDPRDYKVAFDKVRERLGFETRMTVPEGITELISALEEGRFGDPWDVRYRNIP